MFDDRLRNLRQDKKLNMKQTAAALKMPYTTYVSYEKDEREPNSEILVQLANFFDCSVDYLIGRSKHIKVQGSFTNINLSNHEKEVITSYRQKPEMQAAVDRLLGVDEEETELIPTLVAARSKNNDEPIHIENVPDLSKFPVDDTEL